MYLGLVHYGYGSISGLLEKATQNNFEVIMVPVDPIDFPQNIDTDDPLKDIEQHYIYSDLTLSSTQWSSKVIMMLSDQLDCDSSDEKIRKNAEAILERQISWIDHIHYSGYSSIRLKHGQNTNLAHIITKRIKGILLVQVPVYNSSLGQSIWRQDIDEMQLTTMEEEEEQDTWHWWNRFRWSCDFHMKVRVLLEFHEDEIPDLKVVRRWLGEPVEAVILPISIFILNSANYPVLPKQWQNILQYFVKAHVNIMISADPTDTRLKQISHYLKNFLKTHPDGHALQSYEDVLETPLQPLYDNLDSYTYEVFERDPVKYKLYQNAITKALEDRVKDDEVDSKITVIMILGAGRGPLVRAALNASENSGRRIRIYIIEKNPNAIRTLHLMVKKLWHKKDIHLFSKDMREFKPPELGDILVSELLGSFGDNELSPECLDCAQTLLKEDGISIPCKSISLINPIMSSKLYNAMRQLVRSDCARSKDTYSDGMASTYYSPVSSSSAITKETNFVSLLKNIYNIGEPQELFEFIHPNRTPTSNRIDNSRYKRLKFSVELDCVIHGIAGYFEAILYKDIILSINPATHTMSLFSWFPMYFPLTQPLNVKQGETVEVHFWRCTTKQKIWYEWSLTSPQTTHIHNRGGHGFSIYCT